MDLVAAIKARFGRGLSVDVPSRALTIAGMVRLLGVDEVLPADTDPVVALQPLGQLPPFFCVHGIGGNVLHLQHLATHMGTDRPFLGLRRTTNIPLNESISGMAARYVAAMLDRQPAGPFYFGGHSFGAIIAFEIALQLVEQGHDIGLLAIIDQRKPGWRLTARGAVPVSHRILASIPGRIRDEFLRVPPAARVRHIWRVLLRWSKLALGRRVGATLMFDLSDPKHISLYEAHLSALRNYRPRSLLVPITLFRTTKQLLSHLAMDSTLGWSDLTESEVRVRVVPGSHGSVIGEPFVHELAKKLSDDLDVAQGVRRRVEPTDD